MTLISLAWKPHPVLMGDLLVTGGHRRRLKALPSLGVLADLPKSVRQLPILSMVQKVALLSPTVAMAWSGSLVTARRTLTDLRQYLSNSHATSTKDIMSYLNGLDYPDWKKLSLLGLVAEQPGSSGIIRWGVKHRRYTKYGDVWASGSGSDALFSYLDKSDVDGLIYDFPMLVVGAQALTSEFFTTPGLQDGYGGGYEFAYPSSGRIQKFDNLVYVIWFLGNKKQLLKTSANGGVFHATPILIQNFYVDDILISLRSKLIRNTIRGKLLKIGRGDFNIMVAPPPFVGRDAGSGKLNHDTVNMVSIVISAFVVETGGKLRIILTLDNFPKAERPLSVEFNLARGTITMNLAEIYWERLVEALRREPDRYAGWF